MKKALVCAAVLAAGPASAQDWEFAGSIYGWAPSIDASVGTGFGTVDASLSISDVLQNLDMGFMGVLEARKGQFALLGELVYADLAASQDTPGVLYDEARVEVKLTVLNGYAIYRVYDTDRASVDVGGGFRAFDLDIDAALTTGQLPGQSAGSSSQWVVPLVAGRVVAPINDKWFAYAFADVGGLSGSDTTWQAFASIGYRFNDRWSTQVGYRYMDIEKEIGGDDVKLEFSGPLIGFTAEF
jgi:hypothetical protein